MKRKQVDACIYAAASTKPGPSNRDAAKMRVRNLEEKIEDLQQELHAHGLSQSNEGPSVLQRQETLNHKKYLSLPRHSIGNLF